MCDLENIRNKKRANQPILVLIGGETSSGKTTMTRKIEYHFLQKKERMTIISSDHYCKETRYEEVPSLRLDIEYEFQKPENMDEKLLADHLKSLLNGEPIIQPENKLFKAESDSLKNIDISTYKKSKIIIVEGIHILQSENIRKLADLKIYIDADPDLRLIRKIIKSPLLGGVKIFGETIQQCFELWTKAVKPCGEKYILSTKKYADLVITNNIQEEIEEKIKDIINIID